MRSKSVLAALSLSLVLSLGVAPCFAQQGHWAADGAVSATDQFRTDYYELGVGVRAGILYGLMDNVEALARLHYAKFDALASAQPELREFGLAIGGFYVPFRGVFWPRIGATLGTSVFTGGVEDGFLGLTVAGEAQGLYGAAEEAQLMLGVQPGYIVGTESGFFLRYSLGVQVRLGE